MGVEKSKIKRRFPQQEVPRHEIYLSFVNDKEAVDFNRWWQKEGMKLFAEWRKNKQ